MTDPKLPPLPPHAFSRNSGTFAPLYNADQMNDHWLDGYRAGQSSAEPMTREAAYQLLSRRIHPTNMFFPEAMIAAVIEASRRAPARERCATCRDRLYEELRELIDAGSESMTHADAVEQVRAWRGMPPKGGQEP